MSRIEFIPIYAPKSQKLTSSLLVLLHSFQGFPYYKVKTSILNNTELTVLKELSLISDCWLSQGHIVKAPTTQIKSCQGLAIGLAKASTGWHSRPSLLTPMQCRAQKYVAVLRAVAAGLFLLQQFMGLLLGYLTKAMLMWKTLVRNQNEVTWN